MERLTSKYTLWNVACGHSIFIEKARLAERLATIETILGDDYDLDRLRELVEADRNGRCVVLPCKVGDVLYYEDDCGTDTETVNKIVVDIETDWGIYNPNDIGKSVFLTREVEKDALKRMEE